MTNNERRQHNIAVFEDTMHSIEHNAVLKQSVKNSISEQRYIAESGTITLPEPRFEGASEVIIKCLSRS